MANATSPGGPVTDPRNGTSHFIYQLVFSETEKQEKNKEKRDNMHVRLCVRSQSFVNKTTSLKIKNKKAMFSSNTMLLRGGGVVRLLKNLCI